MFMVEVLEEVKAYIVAFLVAFLGTGLGWAFIKCVASGIFKGLKALIVKCEEDNKISKEQVKMFQEQAEKYETKCNELLNKQAEVIATINKYIQVDKSKQDKANELLNELFNEKKNAEEEAKNDEEDKAN